MYIESESNVLHSTLQIVLFIFVLNMYCNQLYVYLSPMIYIVSL